MEGSIFSLIPREHLQDILNTLHECFSVNIELLDENGKTLLFFGEEPDFCSLLKKNIYDGQKCTDMKQKAGRQAQLLCEAYTFSCPANLNHIAFPLLRGGMLLGSVIIGPFLMDTPDVTLVSDLAEQKKIGSALSLKLFESLDRLPVLEPAQVNRIGRLVNHIFTPALLTENAHLLRNQEKFWQQCRINESISVYKGQEPSQNNITYYEKQKELLHKVRAGNVHDAKALLNSLLGCVYCIDGGNPETLRTRAIGIGALLCHAAAEDGANINAIQDLDNHFNQLITQKSTPEEICYLLQGMIEGLMDAVTAEKHGGNRYIRKALTFIAGNYYAPLTLEAVAAVVELSPNYFSSLFRQTVGIGFRDYLTQVRVEESCRLLLSTDYAITDIALAIGFTDQTTYCKCFRRLKGVTPKAYRTK